MDNVNFRGAFLVKNPTPTIKKEMASIVGRKRFLYNNFMEQGDIFCIVSDNKDKKIADLIVENSPRFVYYPKINIYSGFKNAKKEEARKVVTTSTSPKIKSKTILKEMFLPQEVKDKKRMQEYIKRAMKTLGLESDNYKLIPGKGFAYIKDTKTNENIGIISAPSKLEVMYAKIAPKCTDLDPRRYAIDKADGGILHEYKGLKGKEKFNQRFNDAVNYYKSIK